MTHFYDPLLELEEEGLATLAQEAYEQERRERRLEARRAEFKNRLITFVNEHLGLTRAESEALHPDVRSIPDNEPARVVYHLTVSEYEVPVLFAFIGISESNWEVRNTRASLAKWVAQSRAVLRCAVEEPGDNGVTCKHKH